MCATSHREAGSVKRNAFAITIGQIMPPTVTVLVLQLLAHTQHLFTSRSVYLCESTGQKDPYYWEEQDVETALTYSIPKSDVFSVGWRDSRVGSADRQGSGGWVPCQWGAGDHGAQADPL